MRKGGIILLIFLWIMVGAGLIVFYQFTTDKPKIAQENQNYLNIQQAQSGLKQFVDSSMKITQNASMVIPKP